MLTVFPAVLVKNLLPTDTEESLAKFFADLNFPPTVVSIIRQSKGQTLQSPFAFVEYEGADPDFLNQIVATCNGKIRGVRRLEVKYSHSRPGLPAYPQVLR